MAKDTEAAFRWIIGILNEHKIPFLVSGGFAARLYGGARELADIDIDIPEDRFSEMLPDVSGHIKFGPAQYKDDNWDLFLMTLSYEGQDIDLSGALEAKIFDRSKGNWISVKDDFSHPTAMDAYDIPVPVISKEALIKYKKMLGREIDMIDVEQLEK
jgi:hypothetical protein